MIIINQHSVYSSKGEALRADSDEEEAGKASDDDDDDDEPRSSPPPDLAPQVFISLFVSPSRFSFIFILFLFYFAYHSTYENTLWNPIDTYY